MRTADTTKVMIVLLFLALAGALLAVASFLRLIEPVPVTVNVDSSICGEVNT